MLSGCSRIEKMLLAMIIFGVIVVFSTANIALYDFFAYVVTVVQSIQWFFLTVPECVNESVAWIPILSMMLLICMIAFTSKKMLNWVRVFLVGAVFFLHTVYVLYRLLVTINRCDILNMTASSFFFIAELIFYACLISIYLQLIWPTSRNQQADHYEKEVRKKSFYPSVDVFVPTYNEPVDILRRTLIGAQAMEYDCKQVYLLDDKNRPEAKSLAKELGCQYIARKKNIDAKAGNLNNALRQTKGDLIAVFDADCIPVRNFLLRLVGFFVETQTGFVTSAQYFYNGRTVARSVIAISELYPFFSQMQMGKDTYNATMCFGTCFIVRRSALEIIGGMPTETLSEDWALSIKLQAQGWKT